MQDLTIPELYYKEEREEPVYTRKPTNRLDVPRFLKGQAPFLSLSGQANFKKKTIIFDFSLFPELAQPDNIQNSTLPALIYLFYIYDFRILLHAGFNQLLTFSVPAYDEILSYQKDLEPVSSQSLIKTASQKLNLPEDQLFLFDPTCLSLVISQKIFQSQLLDCVLERYEEISVKAELNDLLIKIFLDGYSTTKIRINEEEMNCQYDKSSESFDEQSLYLPKLEHLEVVQKLIDPDPFLRLLIDTILRGDHQIKQLTLENVTFAPNDVKDISFNQLSHLSLNECQLGDLFIRKLLTESSHLQTIKVDDYSLLGPVVDEMNFSKLEFLNVVFKGEHPLDDSFSKILRSSSKLKTLYLKTNVSSEHGPNHFQLNIRPGDLNSLKKLVIHGNFCGDFIEKLLSCAPHLEELKLISASFKLEKIEELKLQRLKSLTISWLEEFFQTDLYFLFKSCPHLESLDLDNVTMPLEQSMLDDSLIAFRQLKRLNISNVVSENQQNHLFEIPEFLKTIIINAVDLKEFHIEYEFPILIGELIDFIDERQLPQLRLLEELLIDPTGEFDEPEKLARLLKNTPGLKRLTMRNCHLYKPIDFPALPKLKHLTLCVDHTDENEPIRTSFDTLAEIVAQTPVLEELLVMNGDDADLVEAMDINIAPLNHLRRCELHGFYSDTVLELVKQWPVLQELLCDYIYAEQYEPEEIESFISKSPLGNRNVLPGNGGFEEELQEPHPIITSVDGNTVNKKNRFNLNRIFFSPDGNHPSPAEYRSNVFDKLIFNPKGSPYPFHLRHCSGDAELVDVDMSNIDHNTYATLIEQENKRNKVNYYYVKPDPIKLRHEWQALPSYSANEIIMNYHVESNKEVELKFSRRDHLYYIRLPETVSARTQKINIDYTIRVAETLPISVFPSEIQGLIKKINGFGEGELDIDELEAGGEDYLKAMLTQEVGACRHRALVFMHEVKKLYPDLPIRYVSNECHAYAEIFYSNQWIKCQLGGYASELNINNKNKPAELHALPMTTKTELSSSGQIKQITPKYFKPKSQEEVSFDDHKAYVHSLLDGENQKTLLQVQHPDDISKYVNAIESDSVMTGRPFFYVHAAEDLICSARFIENIDNKGVVRNGPGGPLYDFLIRHAEDGSAPILLINYDHFNPSEAARFNSLLDDTRKADGIALPDRLSIIGLINPANPNAPAGVDFKSRFKRVITAALTGDQLPLSPVGQIDIVQLSNEFQSEDVVIPFFQSPDWEDLMLGRWQLDGNDLNFIEGKLIRALRDGCTTIELNNAPWSNARFVRFLESALIRGEIDVHGQRYRLPKINRSCTYHWKDYRSLITLSSEVQPPFNAIYLNASTYSKLFSQFKCDPVEHRLIEETGIIKRNAGLNVEVYVASTLSTGEWARLLDACLKESVRIHVHLAPGCQLPSDLQLPKIEAQAQSFVPWNTMTPDEDALIQSEDSDLAAALMIADKKIDISEVDGGQLISKIDGQFLDTTRQFRFIDEDGLLLQALRQGETIVLKGEFSSDLIDDINALLYERRINPQSTGKLIIVNSDVQRFIGNKIFAHQVSNDQKRRLLGDFLEDHVLSTHHYVELENRNRHLAVSGSANIDSIKQGLNELPSSPDYIAFQEEDAESLASEFIQDRIQQLEQALERSPVVFLAGKTAVGKTSFMLQIWSKMHAPLHVGEEQVQAWAEMGGTLFIDECNISARHWSEFEGLFHDPKGMMIENRYYPLTDKHKVIFAGNPVSYGSGRTTPSLLERHPNCVIFEPMPPAFIYQEMLRPILGSLSFAEPLLTMADYLSRLDQDNILISPRELIFMAHLTQAHCLEFPDADVVQVAKHFAYVIGKTLIPDWKKEEFEARFNPGFYIPNDRFCPSDLMINDSNRPALHLLNEFLSLRELRQYSMGPILPSVGIGGLILEGEPGIGKTELVRRTLLDSGVDFVFLPVSMPLEERSEALIKAWDKGLVVVIDEINSSSMLERLLNDLLMGTYNGRPASTPGFMLIGTQNPSTMAGRRQAGQALQRRLITLRLDECSRDDMLAILCAKGLDVERASELLEEYLYLKANNLPGFGELCFRQLITTAEELLYASRADLSLRSSASNINRVRFFSEVETESESEDTSEEPSKKRARFDS